MKTRITQYGRSSEASLQKFSGMTLVELMVVVAILGILAVTVIPNISGSLDRARAKDAVRGFSSFIARAQSRSFGASEPRGFTIQPIVTASDVAGSMTAMSLELFLANVPATYSGDSISSVVSVAANSDPRTGTLSFSASGKPDLSTVARLSNAGFCREGDSIQFGGLGPWFKLIPPETVSMWNQKNQSPYNTVLPRGQNIPYKIQRQPANATVGTFQFVGNTGIDLGYSMLGSRFFSDFVNFNYPITILFDAAGRPFEMVHSGGSRDSLSEPLFFLVGLTLLAGNTPAAVGDMATSIEPEDRTGANWQYSDSVWLMVDHQSGARHSATSSAREGNAALKAGSSIQTAVQRSQYNLRILSGI